MQTFYRVTWQVLFIIFYPFITLFSILFIGLVNVISWISRLFASSKTEPELEAALSPDWAPFAEHAGLSLSRKPVREIQFGPLVYRLRATPASAAIQEGYWGDFMVPFGGGVLLQHWPSIAEHELERFELVYYEAGADAPKVLAEIPSFYWEARQLEEGSVVISWNEGADSFTVQPERVA